MKKLIAMILAVVLCLALCSCGAANESSTEKPQEEQPATAPETKEETAAAPVTEPANTIEKTEKPEKTAEFKTVNFNDTITLDFVEIKLGTIGNGEKIVEDEDEFISRSMSVSNSNNAFFWLGANLKNLNGKAISIYNSKVRLIFDDKYTYDGSIMSLGSWEVNPVESVKVYIGAEVSKELLNQYQKVTIQFGFDENFEMFDYNSEIEDLDCIFQLTAAK